MNHTIRSPIGSLISKFHKPLVVGLVNNTSYRALKATEDQYACLLHQACPGSDLQLKRFSCQLSPGSRHLKDSSGEAYAPVEEMFNTPLDAVIVTGMEPQAANLQDEPAWNSLTRISDWAQDNAVPVLWSCLAAHAIVLYLDGIARSPLPAKLSGVFDCDVLAVDNPLTAGLPPSYSCPHSRHNDLPEALLIARGYRILSRSSEVGVDMFLRPGPAPFVFFQGHPEYDAGSLLLEYTRDVRRYLTGERDEYPLVPKNSIDALIAAQLAVCRDHALSGFRDPSGLKEITRLLAGVSPLKPWHLPAVRIFVNWIAGVIENSLRLESLRRISDRNAHCRPDLVAAREC